jgi:hypothetical protein
MGHSHISPEEYYARYLAPLYVFNMKGSRFVWFFINVEEQCLFTIQEQT